MKDGYYWVRFSPKMNGWVMMTVSNGYIYKKDIFGAYDFGTVGEFLERYPGIEIVEIEKPKSKELIIIVDVLVSGFKTTVGKVIKQGSVTYAVVNECDKEAFLDDVAQYYRNRAEELLYARPEI